MDRYLSGWKAIAAHVGVSVRTAQRYERTLGLPVERLPRPGGTEDVRASREAVDHWLEQTATRRAADVAERTDGGTSGTGGENGSAVSAASAPGRTVHADHAQLRPPMTSVSTGWRTAALMLALLLAAVIGFAAARLTAPVPALPRALPVVPASSPPSNIVGDMRGQLVGRIAVDTNGNGEWDAGELFVGDPGRECANTETAGGFVVRWTGPADGSTSPLNCNPEPFFHGRLAPGRYVVTLDVPVGWQATSPDKVAVDIEPGRDTHLWFAVSK